MREIFRENLSPRWGGIQMRPTVDLPAPHAAPLFLSDLPIFRGVDIKQFVRLATWESDGLSVERARKLVQRKLPGGHLSLHDRQRRATQ